MLLCAGALLLAVATATRAGAAERDVLESEADDRRVGAEVARQVEAQVGLLNDPALDAYVEGIGRKLLRGLARRPFAFRFRVVDQVEPNAFALPGGYVFVSRGLLALARDEDELACVIGHEIAHVAKRHAAAAQSQARGQMPLLWPVLLAGRRAAYARDLERSADRDGQILCATAGYDPRGLATFLETLARAEKFSRGYARNAGFFDTHPGSTGRANIALVHASELRWLRDPDLGDPRAALLDRLDGLPVGDRPESGIFRGPLFLHPVLDFKLRFPARWETANAPRMVGARAPRRDAFVYLTADVPPNEPRVAAEAWAREEAREHGRVNESGPIRIGPSQGWQLDLTRLERGARVRSLVAFVAHGQSTYRLTGAGISDRELKRAGATIRSFRPLSPDDLRDLTVTRLRLVEARPDEDLVALVKRTSSAWAPFEVAVHNSLATDHRFAGGERVKIARAEPYRVP